MGSRVVARRLLPSLPSLILGDQALRRAAAPRLLEEVAQVGEADRSAHVLSFIRRNSAIRALTSLFTRAGGAGLVSGNRMVPFEVAYPLSSAAWARLTAALIGYKLQWCLKAAYH